MHIKYRLNVNYNYHWLAPGYHQQVVCVNRPQCPLSGQQYFENLVDIVDRITENSGWIREKNYSLVVPDARSSFHDPDDTVYFGLDLTDYRLRNRFLLLEATTFSGASGKMLLQEHSAEEEINVFCRLAQEFRAVVPKTKDNEFDGRLELILWCLLNGRNINDLKWEIDAHKDIIPPCIMSSLLFCALRAHYSDGVRLLLEKGASPHVALVNSGNALESQPIMCGFYMWETPRADDIEAELQMIDCLNALVQHGSSLMAKEKFSEAIPLHFLFNLSVRSMEASKAMVRMTPTQGLSLPAIIQRWKRVIVGSVTPLEAIIVDIAAPNAEGEDERQIYLPSEYHRRVAQMVHGAAFPLLRAGARFSRDPLEENIGESQFRLFAGMVESPFLTDFLTILIAGRCKTGLNVEKFLKNVNRLQTHRNGPGTFNDNHRFFFINFSNASEDASHFEKAVARMFPLKLQHICRIEILKLLPIGSDARRAAIEQLCLPGCLGQFLNFEML